MEESSNTLNDGPVATFSKTIVGWSVVHGELLLCALRLEV